MKSVLFFLIVKKIHPPSKKNVLRGRFEGINSFHKPYFTSIYVISLVQLELLIRFLSSDLTFSHILLEPIQNMTNQHIQSGCTDMIQSACAGSVQVIFLDLY